MLPERVGNWSDYPFNVPTIASLRELEIKKPVVFFVGENGSGKSTLLEAIAIHYGFGGEGGNRNFSSATTEVFAVSSHWQRLCASPFRDEPDAVFSCELRASSILPQRLTRSERLALMVAAAFTPSRTASHSLH